MTQFLCSHLVRLIFSDHETGGNLERIWENGATVDSEEPVAPGTRVNLSFSTGQLLGTVVSCEIDPLGNFLDIALDVEWTVETFLPDHLTDVTPLSKFP